MSLYFANPLGWLGLIGLGPLVYLHFFRRQTKRRRAPGLFLVKEIAVSREAGNRLQNWRRSLSFWMQALAIVLLSALLAGPRSVAPDRVATVVFCLDASVSMNAFREPMIEAVEAAGKRLQDRLPRIEWVLVDTVDDGRNLYRGADLGAALAALGEWQAMRGTHDPVPALRDATQLTEAGGVALFVSDRRIPGMPTGSHPLLVGSPIANIGVTGSQAFSENGERLWRASVRNFGDEARETSWFVEADGARTEAKPLRLEPQETVILQGPFPEGATRLSVRLGADAFAMDNVAPIVFPAPKRLAVSVEGGSERRNAILRRMAESVPHCDLVAGMGQSDLALRSVDAGEAIDSTRPGIYLVSDGGEKRPIAAPDYTLSNDPMCKGIGWDGLLAEGVPGFAFNAATDKALVWRGSELLAFVRDRALFLNIDLERSNADRIPGFVLLLYRFIEDARSRKVGRVVENYDVGQALEIAWPPLVGLPEIRTTESTAPIERPAFARAPEEPGFFSVHANGTELVVGAAQFADARESDFRDAETYSEFGDIGESLRERFYDRELYPTLLTLALCGLVLGHWYACYRENL